MPLAKLYDPALSWIVDDCVIFRLELLGRTRRIFSTPPARTFKVNMLASFNCQDWSDVRLVFTTSRISQSPPEYGGDEPMPDVPSSFHVHAIVLGSSSEYFRARLENKLEGSGSGACPTSSQRVLELPVEEEELEAAQLVLRCMYGASLEDFMTTDNSSKLILLARAYRLSDRLQAQQCMELFSQAINAFSSSDVHQLSPEAINVFCQLVVSNESHRVVVDALCKAHLLRLFGDVPEVVEREGPLALFLCLSYPAVLKWAMLDGLSVHSENCLMYLLSVWVSKHPECTAQQLEQLAQQVRVKNLSPSYIHAVLPTTDWFCSCPGVKRYLSILVVVKKKLKAAGWPGSAAWVLPPRAQKLVKPAPLSLDWDLSQDDLQKLRDSKGVPLLSPSTVYLNGFWIGLCAEYRHEGGGGLYVGMRAAAQPSVSCAKWSERGLMVCTGSISAMLPSSMAYEHKRDLGLGCCEGFGSSGIGDFLGVGRDSGSLDEAVTPFLVDGKLKLRASILKAE